MQRTEKTENIRVHSDVMNRLRKRLSIQTEGRVYGLISVTVETAINEYLDRIEKAEKQKQKAQATA